MIGDALAAGFRSEQQINLFGAAELTRSLMGERVRVLDRALSDLSQNKKLFGTLSQRADTIEANNNQLDRFGNQLKANQAARLGDLLTRLAQRTGPVSDALNRAAARMVDGSQKMPAASRQFLDDVEALLTRDGIDALLAEPKLKPAAIVEPGSKDAADMAERALAERQAPARSGDEFSDGEPSLFGQVALGNRIDGGDTRLLTRADALAEADRPTMHADLIASCKD